MAVQINSRTTLEGFPERKEEYIEKYYNLILEKAPKYEMFAFHELYTVFGFEWNSIEQQWLNLVSDDVRRLLLNDYYIDWEHGSNIYVRLTEKGRVWRDKKANSNNTIPLENSVSAETLNSVLNSVSVFTLPTSGIIEFVPINVGETKLAIDVLKHYGYIAMAKQKESESNKNIKYYSATTLGKEILKNGGFKTPLSMPSKSINKIKTKKVENHGQYIEKANLNNSQVMYNHDSRFEHSDISNTITSAPNPNDKKHSPIVSFLLKFWWAIIIPLIIGIILIYFEVFVKSE